MRALQPCHAPVLHRHARTSRVLTIRCSSASPSPADPWNFAYIHRERTSVWTNDNKARLIKLIASNQLSIPVRDLEYRVFELTLLVPDLAKRLHTLSPATLATLLTNTAAVATRLIALRQLLPTANVGALVARQPDILLQDERVLVGSVARLKDLLGVASVDALLEAEPRLFDVDLVAEVLDELARLMPTHNPRDVLLSDPSWVLKVERGPRRLGQHPDM